MNSTTKAPASSTTTAFTVQSAIAFSVALGMVLIGLASLPVSGWVRAFLALGTVFLVSSTFSLAKCIRDRHESESVVGRIDAARIERLLATYDPYKVDQAERSERTEQLAAPFGGLPPYPTPSFDPAR